MKRPILSGLDEAKKALDATLDMMKLKTQEFQKQEGEFALPLLDIKGPGQMAAPLVNGVAKYLDRLGDEKVEVIVTVRRARDAS